METTGLPAPEEGSACLHTRCCRHFSWESKPPIVGHPFPGLQDQPQLTSANKEIYIFSNSGNGVVWIQVWFDPGLNSFSFYLFVEPALHSSSPPASQHCAQWRERIHFPQSPTETPDLNFLEGWEGLEFVQCADWLDPGHMPTLEYGVMGVMWDQRHQRGRFTERELRK